MDDVMDKNTRYEANDQVVVTDLGDELVVMAPASGKMFSLNSSGRTLWQRLPATVDELAEALCEAFEVSQADAKADSEAWLAALVEVGLVQAETRELN
jgi:PqqD family protein of HPr-rel-A system